MSALLLTLELFRGGLPEQELADVLVSHLAVFLQQLTESGVRIGKLPP